MINHLGKFENLSILILENSIQKIIDASILFNNECYSSSYFLSIISQEELSKLYVLPYINSINELDNYLKRRQNKKDVLFSHRIKQNIFSSYGIQERSNIHELESKKQNSIYVGFDVDNTSYNHPNVIKKEDAENEIINSFILSLKIFKNYIGENDFTQRHKELLLECIYKLQGIPSYEGVSKKAIERVKSYEEKYLKNLESFKELIATEIASNPFENIKIFKLIFGEEFKKHIKEIIHLPINDLANYVGKNTDGFNKRTDNYNSTNKLVYDNNIKKIYEFKKRKDIELKFDDIINYFIKTGKQ